MIQLVQNKKTKGIYQVLFTEAINCTNAQDGQIMVAYTDGEKLFVREQKEFCEKFVTVKLGPKDFKE